MIRMFARSLRQTEVCRTESQRARSPRHSRWSGRLVICRLAWSGLSGRRGNQIRYVGPGFQVLRYHRDQQQFLLSAHTVNRQVMAAAYSTQSELRLYSQTLQGVHTQARAEDEKAFREGMEPLAAAGKLGAVLIQFPWSFKNELEERTYLNQLVKRFKDYPLVVELRHESWNNPRNLQTLEDLGVGLCDIDQPLFSNSIKPSAEVTSPIGYVRLHGRNYQNWFREEANVLERYDYLYSRDELEPWVRRIKEVAAKAKQTFVITNNHARGQNLVNAFEILAQLEEEQMSGPAKLIETYPRLAESVEPDDEDQQPSLF